MAETATKTAGSDKTAMVLSDHANARRQFVPVRRVRGSYDAATLSDDNSRHWANADALSADAANSLGVRKRIRQHARYEIANNSYAKGIIETLANDSIGATPRMFVQTDNETLDRLIEREFHQWSRAIHLAEKLRTMKKSKTSDGEAFGVFITNPDLETITTLDLSLVECDRVTSPTLTVGKNNNIDGVIINDYGTPMAYQVLKNHPGNTAYFTDEDFETIPARNVIHWFRPDRPEQHRGISEILSALPLFSQLRRYTLAVIAAAETAADFAAVLYTDAPANGEAVALDPMDVVDLEKRMATTLPDGWKLGQLKAEQPSTTYDMFKREILNEIARCLNLPYNIAACNSAGYNYASGRLDHQTYYKAITVERSHLIDRVLDPIFRAWIMESRYYLGLDKLAASAITPEWFFDGNEHVDPAKEANAQGTRLKNHTTTLAAEFARQGKDWETEIRQRAKEKALLDELGLSAAPAAPASPAPSANQDDDDDDADDADNTEDDE